MIKKLLSQVMFLLFLFSISTTYMYGVEKTDAQCIKDFYTWYITTNKGSGYALSDKEIYRYVDIETVENVKKASMAYSGDRRDYFLKMADPPLNMLGVNISIKHVADLGDGTLVARVDIDTILADEFHNNETVIVIAKKRDGYLKITKCIDSYPE